MGNDSSDQALFSRIQAGDAQAFRTLVDTHSKPLITYVTRILKNQSEAEEVVQEVFVRAWKNAGSYRPEARATTWLHHIAHNLAIDVIRKRRPNVSLEFEDDPAPASTRPTELLEQKQRATSLKDALELLGERQKMAMLLKYEQGLSGAEIGRVLDLSEDAVLSLLARARAKLVSILEPGREP